MTTAEAILRVGAYFMTVLTLFFFTILLTSGDDRWLGVTVGALVYTVLLLIHTQAEYNRTRRKDR